ncbi:MAG: GNAT family N-acetyltransferase [Gelidibacter sp.]|nr:GNAT family N-acetyltransferase [Gelidibacter sp.]
MTTTKYHFKKLDADPDQFFDILPQDWQDEIVPHWDNYKNTATIYIIESEGHVIAGGILFSTCSPDISYYKKEAQSWFDKGYLYIGYLWVAEDMRNMNLGSFWLNQLKKELPEQHFWLLIEEERLHNFYLKNDFRLIETLKNDVHSEWLYAF